MNVTAVALHTCLLYFQLSLAMKLHIFVEYEVSTAVVMKRTTIFWDITTYNAVH
jgi:hypothetical protein